MRRRHAIIVASLLAIAACSRDSSGSIFAPATAGAQSVAQQSAAAPTTPPELKWGPAPPVFEPGAQLAVLQGDPSKAGEEFTVRLRMPNGYKIAPHWHSNDEELTVLSGTFVLAMGDKAGENVHAMEAGAYHFLPGKMHHSAEAKGETLIEIHGIGPFDLHYLNPADDPSKTTAATK